MVGGGPDRVSLRRRMDVAAAATGERLRVPTVIDGGLRICRGGGDAAVWIDSVLLLDAAVL